MNSRIHGSLVYVLACLGTGCVGAEVAGDDAPATSSEPHSSSSDSESSGSGRPSQPGSPPGLPSPASTTSPEEHGELGPLIPTHKDAVHAGFYWDAKGTPKILIWMRPSEYKGTDLVDPNVGEIGELRESFRQVVYGGFTFSATLERSLLSRFKADIELENTLAFDITHPDAFKNTGKFDIKELDEYDAYLNADAFTERGSSAGLNYNLFCAGQTTLPDGRWLVVGGHDKAGNNGIRKLNIFDPISETWVHRKVPPVKAAYELDPTDSYEPPNPSALDEDNTDPPARGDMKYQRWYPTAVTLPDGKVLILSGTDQDTSVGPENAALTKVRQVVPEVYDPKTDTTVALKNASKLLPMYARSFVVQTGRHKNDWKVAVVAEAEPPFPTGEDLRGYDPWQYNGNTHYLDVRAALADFDRDKPGQRHWKRVDKAEYAHVNGASVALWELDARGQPLMQRVALFGGDSGTGEDVAAVEMIDFSDRYPRWKRQEDLIRPATQNNAVALPDGTVLIVGGRGGPEGEERVNTYEYQLFNPDSGEIKTVAKTTVPRHDHSTLLLAPDGSVYSLGGNRVDLVPDHEDLGVPVLQVYKPAYMFKGSRPVIAKAPKRIKYGRDFEVALERPCDRTSSVVIMRTDPVTHNWSWGMRYVKLSFEKIGSCKLKVHAPATGAVAPGGNYLLFVLDERNVPSEAKHVRVKD